MSVILPIEDDSRYRTYTASASQTVFPVAFPFQDNSDIGVYYFDEDSSDYIEISNTLYTLTGAGNASGGSLAFTTGRTAGDKILILGKAVLERLSSVVRDGRFSSLMIDDELDRNRLIQQEQQRDLSRAIKMQLGDGPGLIIASDLEDGDTLMKSGSRLVKGPNAADIEAVQGNAAIVAEDRQAVEAAAQAVATGLDSRVRWDQDQELALTARRQGRKNIGAGADTRIVSCADFGAVPDCSGQGVGTDVGPAILAAWNYAVSTYGDGATVVLPAGRYRLTTPVALNGQGKRCVSLKCEGVITTDAVSMVAMLFQNAYDLRIDATAMEGGIFDGWAATLPFRVNYGSTEEAVDDPIYGGGQEFIKVAGVFGYEVNLQGTNYAGRLLRTTTRLDASHPQTGAIRGSIETGRDEKTAIARCAQALWADSGSVEGVGNWGSLERKINDFDSYAPVWRGLNDLEVIGTDAAYSFNGLIFMGCVVVKLVSAYVGDIDGLATADHISFIDSPSGRHCSQIRVDGRCLNAGHGLYLNTVDDFDVTVNYVAPNSALPMLFGARLVNCTNGTVRVAATGYGTSLVAISGASSDNITVIAQGRNLTLAADGITIASEVVGMVNLLDCVVANAPAGYALLKVAGLARVNIVGGTWKQTRADVTGYVFDIAQASNNVVAVGQNMSISGLGALNKTNAPRSLTRYNSTSYWWGPMRSNDGGNSVGAGGSMAFGIAAGIYTAYSQMSQIAGYLENSVGTELQGGISFSTRASGVAGQALTERLRITSAGVLQFLTQPGSYASDSAAAAAGVPVGGVYKNSSTNALTTRAS